MREFRGKQGKMRVSIANDRWFSVRHADGTVSYPLERAAQPQDGYRKIVTPTGPNVRYEDAFPESCCEGAPAPAGARDD